MALGMKTLVETRNYTITKYRTGSEITDRLFGTSVYLQPGDDEWALLNPLEALEERYGSLDDHHDLVDRIAAEYFTH